MSGAFAFCPEIRILGLHTNAISRIAVRNSLFYPITFIICLFIVIFKIKWSSTVGHENNFKIVGVLLSNMKIIKIIGFLLSRSGVLLSDIFNNTLNISSCVLEFYCRWGWDEVFVRK